MKKLMYFLLSRKRIRIIAWAIENRSAHWYDHILLSGEGHAHIVHNSQTFSVYCKTPDHAVLLTETGDIYFELNWLERKIVCSAIAQARQRKGFTDILVPMELTA